MPGDVVSYVSRQAEVYLIRFIMDVRSVGILDMAYKFPPLLNMFITIPFTQAWRTKSIEVAEHQQEAPAIIGRMFTNYFFIMVFAGLVLAVSIGDLLMLLTPREFWGAARIARIEIVTTILAGATAFFSFGLMFRKMTGRISTVRMSMALVKIPLACVMIFSFQLAGAAYSALIVEGITTWAMLTLSQKHFRVEYEYARLLIIAGIGLLICAFITNDGVAQAFNLATVRQATLQLAKDLIGLAPLAGPESGKWLKVVLDRQDSLISLFINLCCSLVFLVAAPLLFLPRSAKRVAVP
jgi:O-antigen/teichoic acid export membrane protein